jgi:hypothetical protein
MNSSFYVLAGIGSVDFAGDNRLTLNFGAGFRVLPTDWLAIHLGVQDRVFDSDLLGETKVTNNMEMLLSATVFSDGVSHVGTHSQGQRNRKNRKRTRARGCVRIARVRHLSRRPRPAFQAVGSRRGPSI